MMHHAELDVAATIAACGEDHILTQYWAQSYIALGTMISVLGAFTGLTVSRPRRARERRPAAS